MFIISFIATDKLGITGKDRYLLWLIILLSTLASSLLFRKFFPLNHTLTPSIPSNQPLDVNQPNLGLSRLIDQTILGSFEILTKVGGYIILFSILAKIIQDIPIFPLLPKLILIGTLEITTGIEAVTQSSIPYMQKIILCCSITAFGGLSALAQTKSVMESTGLSLIRYSLCKLLSAFFTIFLCCLLHI
jgi:hypothetical protein